MRVAQRMGHVALRVPDLEATIRHYVEIVGLRVVEEVDGWTYLTCGPRHHDLMLREGEAALDHFSFETWNPEAIDWLTARLNEDGVEIISEEPEEIELARAIRFRAPGGHVIEVYEGMGQVDGHYNGPGVRPRKYGHTTLRVLNLEEMATFLNRTVGLIQSDRVGAGIMWMRCDADHHGLAMLQGPQAGLHHHAWEVENWAYIETLGDHLMRNGQTFVFGPGRHGPGLNLFCYHLDPAGACIEYFADMEQIHDDSNTGRVWPEVPESINQWGPAAPEAFMQQCTPVLAPAAVA